MVTYSADIPTIQQITAEMGTLSNYIHTLLSDLESSTVQNMADWQSGARDAYNSAKAIWDQACADMAVQAANAQSALSSITDNYIVAELQGAGLWGR